MPIKIRAHHLNCMLRFYRGGYDEIFAKNMKDICKHIRENPNVKVQIVVAEPDVLCMKCPY